MRDDRRDPSRHLMSSRPVDRRACSVVEVEHLHSELTFGASAQKRLMHRVAASGASDSY